MDDKKAKPDVRRVWVEQAMKPGTGDHTTVLHACRRVKFLKETESRVEEDYANLLRTLTG